MRALTTSKKTPAASTPKTSCKGWQFERRHEYSPANETAYKFCKGDIRPRGQWPKYRGRRLKRRVATKGFASPVPIPPPPTPGSGPAGPANFAYFPSLESRPPEAGPANETQRETRKRHPPSEAGPGNVNHPTFVKSPYQQEISLFSDHPTK